MKGFILIPVLIFTLAIAMLSLASLSLLKQAMQLQGYNQNALQLTNDLIHYARHLENTDTSVCNIEITTNLQQKPKQWWLDNACNADKYLYVIEDLGVDVCAHFHNHVAHFYRLTVATHAKEVQDIKSFIQVIFARRAKTNEPCKGKARQVSLGEQQLREL